MINALNGTQIPEVIIEYLEMFPAPDRIRMGNGREFKKGLVENLLETQGTEAHYVPPNHSNSSGLLNRTRSTLIEILRAVKETSKRLTTSTRTTKCYCF